MIDKLKGILLGAAVVIAVGAALYVGGYWYASKQFEEEKQQFASQATTSSTQLASIANSNHLLRARISLYRAAGQLDQRNFGTANSHLALAAADLSKVSADAVADTAVLDALRSELAATNIQVAEDLESQRARVLDFGKRLDALLPPISAESTPTPTTPTAMPAPAQEPAPVQEPAPAKPSPP